MGVWIGNGTYEEHADCKEEISQLLERRPLDYWSRPPRRKSLFRQDICYDETRQFQEPQRPNRPAKSHPRQELLDHSREHDAADSTPARRNANSQAPPAREIRRDQRQHRSEETAVPKTDTHALREKQLPVLCREGRREDPEDLQDGAEEEDGAEVACVCEAAGEGADEEEEEDLDAADPGDVGGWAREGGHVVGLEDAEGVDEAPGVHHHEVAHCALRPG